MPLDVAPTEIVTLGRDDWRTRYLRSYKVRLPNADTLPDSMPWIDASCIADQLVILSEDARRTSKQIPLDGKTGDELDEFGARLQLPRAPAAAGAGYVSIKTSSGGATLTSGALLTDDVSGLSFTFTGATASYSTGAQVPITCTTTGPGTNLSGGTQVKWSAPSAGLFPTATIVTQPNGSGLSGGANVESDDSYRERIRERLANGGASGNDAAYQQLTEDTVGHGVAVAKAFTFPAVLGPGTIAVCFVLVPNGVNSTRIPSSAQISTVQGFVTSNADVPLPADDSSLWPVMTAQPTGILLSVSWTKASPSWQDLTPWPPFYATTPLSGPGGLVIDPSVTPTPTSFKIKTTNGTYTSVVQPSAGQTIGLFDPTTGRFFKKRILSFTGTGPWTVTVDTTNNASDTSYTPVSGQRVMPWSDSLQNLSDPVIEYFATLGPGEIASPPGDGGQRMIRSPASPREWPSVITNRLVIAALDVADVNDAEVLEGLGTTTTQGDVTQVFLQTLGELAVFKK